MIEAMKQALEALETCMYPQQKQMQAITSLRQAIAEAEKHKVSQEPVAWMDKNKFEHLKKNNAVLTTVTSWGAFDDDVPLYTHPQPKREPVAWEQLYPDIGKPQLEYLPASPFDISGKPQPKREWVGLSGKERMEFVEMYAGINPNLELFAREIEAKLKEKNFE
jgi:hypothetical protein